MSNIRGNVSLVLAMQGQESVSKSLKSAQAGLDKTTGFMEKLAQIGGNSIAKFKAELTGLPGKITDINSAFELAQKGVDKVRDAFNGLQDAERDMRALTAFTDGFGVSMSELDRIAEQTGYQLSNLELAKMANKGKQFGLSLDDINVAMRVASTRAAEGTESFETLYDAIVETAAGTVASADTFNEKFGSVLDLKGAMDDYAATLGKTAAELTLAEQRAAATAATFKDVRENLDPGEIEAQAQGWNRLGRYIDNTTDSVVNFAAEVSGSAIDTVMDIFTGNAVKAAKELPLLNQAMRGNMVAASKLAAELGLNERQTRQLLNATSDMRGMLGQNTEAAGRAGVEFNLLTLQLGAAARKAKEADTAFSAAAATLQNEWAEALKRIKEADDYFNEESRKAEEEYESKRQQAAEAAARTRIEQQKAIQEALFQLREANIARLDKLDQIEAQRRIDNERTLANASRTRLGQELAGLQLELTNRRAATNTAIELERQRDEAAKSALSNARALEDIRLDMQETALLREDVAGRARIQLQRDLYAIERSLQAQDISEEVAAEEVRLAYLRQSQANREDLHRRNLEMMAEETQRSEQALAAFDQMTAGAQRSSSTIARVFATTTGLISSIALNAKEVAKGSSAAIIAIAEKGTAAIASERAQAAVLALVSTATGFLEIARGNPAGAAAAFTAAATFGAVAGGAGGPSSGGAVPASGGSGGGTSFGSGGGFLSQGPSSGGQQTFIVEGWRGQDLVGQIAGDVDRARRNGVDRRRL